MVPVQLTAMDLANWVWNGGKAPTICKLKNDHNVGLGEDMSSNATFVTAVGALLTQLSHQ